MKMSPRDMIAYCRTALVQLGFLAFFLLFLVNVSFAQFLQKDWDKTYGGVKWEECNTVISTIDGGYLMAGYTTSIASGHISEDPRDFAGISSQNKGDFWLLKTDENGNKVWDKRLGGGMLDRLWSAEQTVDGGYILGGWSESPISGDKSEDSFGDFDYWVIKTDNTGQKIWDRTFGGSERDLLYDLIQTSDGGFLMVGNSNSPISGTKTEALIGEYDLWIVKIDANGNLKWEKTIGGTEEERVNEVLELADGNYILGGSTESPTDGLDLTELAYGGKDYWVIKIDSLDGSKYWERRYGGTEEDEIQAFIQTSDGGFLFTGGSRSPANPPIKTENSQSIDIWALKTDADGVIQWDRTLGGAEFDNCYTVKENTVGYFVLGGYSQSDLSATKTSPNKGPVGTNDFWINYLSPNGFQQWDHAFGGTDNDVMENFFQTDDGGYILAGHSRSLATADKSEDPIDYVPGGPAFNDFWIVKTLCNVSVEFQDTIVCPNVDFVLDATDPNCLGCNWLWEDNSTDSLRTLNINAPSIYSVTLTDAAGCTWSDDISLTPYVVGTIELGPDELICEGDSLLTGIPNNPAWSYSWSTGELDNSIYIYTTGTYLLDVTDLNGCIMTDSMHLDLSAIAPFSIGNDTSLCLGESLSLSAPTGYSSYSWSTGGVGPSSTVTPTQPVEIISTVVNSDGCSRSDTMNVVELYASPSIANLTTECATDNNSYTLSFDLTSGNSGDLVLNNISGSWNGNVFTSDTFVSSDIYDFSIESSNGCTSEQLTGTGGCVCLSNAGVIAPSSLDICSEPQAITMLGSFLDPNDKMIWLLHDGSPSVIGTILYTYYQPLIGNDGALPIGVTYYLTAVVGNMELTGGVDMTDGCLSQSLGIPIQFLESPTALIIDQNGQLLDCDNTALVLDASSSTGSNIDFSWFTFDGNITSPLNDIQISLNAAGTYFLIATGQNGCSSADSILITADEDLPVVLLSDPSELTCTNQSIDILTMGSSQGPNFEYTWQGNGVNGSSANQIHITEPGTYSLQIFNTTTNCPNVASVTISQNIDEPIVDYLPVQELDCQSNQLMLVSQFQNNCPSCEISWNSTQGSVVSSNSTLTPLVEGMGNYSFVAIDNSNGCEFTGITEVVENTNQPYDANLIPQGPHCETDQFGNVLIEGISGGTPPFNYSLDGVLFQGDDAFSGLVPGAYELMVVDDKNCVFETDFVIPYANPFFLELGEDLTIGLGDSTELVPITNANIDAVTWIETGTENCLDCLIPVVSPLKTTVYTLEIITKDGCVAMDRITVKVKAGIDSYVPNVFSPNGDGSNDIFKPFFVNKEAIRTIESFAIYNRWGALIYRELPLVNDSIFGWDGKYKGKYMNPDVFIYHIVLTLINGDEVALKGDVTLLK